MLDQIDELAARDPIARFARGEQLLHILMAGDLGIGLDRLQRQRGDVAALDQFRAQRGIRSKTGGLQQIVHIGGIVLGIEIERVARLVLRSGAVEAQFEVIGFLVRLRGIEIDQLDDLRLDRAKVGRRRRLAAEVDGNDAARSGVLRGRQRLQRGLDPLAGRFVEIEVAIDAVGHALAAQFFQPCVDLFADAAEIRIGSVAERKHAKLHALDARRGVAHQFAIGADGAAGRVALAPGRGDEDDALGGSEIAHLEIGHVDDGRLQIHFARRLGHVGRQPLGISGLGGIDDGQRLSRLRGRCRLRRGLRSHRGGCRREDGAARRGGSGIKTCEETRQPGALDRRGRSHHPVEDFDVLGGKRSGARDRPGTHVSTPVLFWWQKPPFLLSYRMIFFYKTITAG